MCSEPRTIAHRFDDIAPVYDLLNRIISWGQDRSWRRDLVRRMDLKPGKIVLDISAGTGDMEMALNKICPNLKVIGLDPSRPMLDLYRSKIPQANVNLGVAESMPLKDASVSRIICAFGLRNFHNRETAFKEIYRILEPSGLWGFLEMAAPSGIIFSPIYGFYFKHMVPLIGAIISGRPEAYQYLSDSVYRFPDFKILTAEHQRAGFSLYFYKPILRGAVVMYIFRKS